MVGVGPGDPLDRTRRAEQAIRRSEVVAGYHAYVEMIADLTAGKEVLATGMAQEVERCEVALRRAAEGVVVSLVSSGDPGVYGMAGLVLQQSAVLGIDVPIEIIPGISAAGAAAAKLGAPLMLDFACISLSDLLVSWDQIAVRLEAVACADLAVALYNPRSRTRIHPMEDAATIFRRYRAPSTLVGIATALGSPNEQIVMSDLDHFTTEEIGMRSTVLIGSSTTRLINNRMVTPRGYRF